MIWCLILLLVVLVCWLINKSTTSFLSNLPKQGKASRKFNIPNESEQTPDIEYLTDEYGKKYKLSRQWREVPRKTYLNGRLRGKYYGEKDEIEETFSGSKFYGFTVYDAHLIIVEDGVSTLEPLEKKGASFPKDRIPQSLICTASLKGEEELYEINLLEPRFENIQISQRLHQTENLEVFGTLEANVQGYILDHIKQLYEERDYLESDKIEQNVQSVATRVHEKTLVETGVATGKSEVRGSYERLQYYYSDYKQTYWGNWKYKKMQNSSFAYGILETISIFVLVSVFFIILVTALPKIGFFLLFLCSLLLLQNISSQVWQWLVCLVGSLLFLIFLTSVYHAIVRKSVTEQKVFTSDTPSETTSEQTIVKPSNSKLDTTIIHKRIWKDYDGNIYSGSYRISKRDVRDANFFKNTMSEDASTPVGYDLVMYSLNQRDKNCLDGVYKLFDSLGAATHVNRIVFAEMIVSFVQDIPYALILPASCDPGLYNDNFIKSYLTRRDSDCQGFERFGLNTPVEFLASLKGDCDTRTLLLYTLLDHYHYDVVVLSSEFYNHSLLGINMDADGTKFTTGNRSYIMCETTVPGLRPGLIPQEISNTNFWRISLINKAHEH